MTYSLGQAKWVPGQIHFQTTRTGKLPSVQPLIERGLPYAPYIEHGSFTTGQPDIARYGRDPYRGISGPIGYLGDQDTADEIRRRADQTQREAERHAEETAEVLQQTIRTGVPTAMMIGIGVAAGAVGGAVGGALDRTLLGALLGAGAGAGVGYVARRLSRNVGSEPAPEGTAGIDGILAVM